MCIPCLTRLQLEINSSYDYADNVLVYPAIEFYAQNVTIPPPQENDISSLSQLSEANYPPPSDMSISNIEPPPPDMSPLPAQHQVLPVPEQHQWDIPLQPQHHHWVDPAQCPQFPYQWPTAPYQQYLAPGLPQYWPTAPYTPYCPAVAAQGPQQHWAEPGQAPAIANNPQPPHFVQPVPFSQFWPGLFQPYWQYPQPPHPGPQVPFIGNEQPGADVEHEQHLPVAQEPRPPPDDQANVQGPDITLHIDPVNVQDPDTTLHIDPVNVQDPDTTIPADPVNVLDPDTTIPADPVNIKPVILVLDSVSGTKK